MKRNLQSIVLRLLLIVFNILGFLLKIQLSLVKLKATFKMFLVIIIVCSSLTLFGASLSRGLLLLSPLTNRLLDVRDNNNDSQQNSGDGEQKRR